MGHLAVEVSSKHSMGSANGNIRPASAHDVSAICELERQTPAAAHWSQKEYEVLFSAEDGESSTQGGFRRLAFVAEAESRLLGFVVARILGSEWEIENMAVAAAAQRRGLGSRLLGALLEKARSGGAESVFLEVRETNSPARSLYEKHAFAESGRRKLYYCSPDEDAIMYRLRLK